MIRRQFLGLAALAGVSSLAAIGETRTVTYRVKGFSCPTCAVGLDTMLTRHHGIARSHSTYPEGIVTIDFDPGVIAESAIRGYIAEMGFTVEGH
jgi:copper chaperone CopZ